jgi:hypothetical protein
MTITNGAVPSVTRSRSGDPGSGSPPIEPLSMSVVRISISPTWPTCSCGPERSEPWSLTSTPTGSTSPPMRRRPPPARPPPPTALISFPAWPAHRTGISSPGGPGTSSRCRPVPEATISSIPAAAARATPVTGGTHQRPGGARRAPCGLSRLQRRGTCPPPSYSGSLTTKRAPVALSVTATVPS